MGKVIKTIIKYSSNLYSTLRSIKSIISLKHRFHRSNLSHLNKVHMQNTQMKRNNMLLSHWGVRMAVLGAICPKIGMNSVNDLAQ